MNTIIALLNWFIRKWNEFEERRKKKKHDDDVDALRYANLVNQYGSFVDSMRKRYSDEIEKSLTGLNVNTSFTSSTSSEPERDVDPNGPSEQTMSHRNITFNEMVMMDKQRLEELRARALRVEQKIEDGSFDIWY